MPLAHLSLVRLPLAHLPLVLTHDSSSSSHCAPLSLVLRLPSTRSSSTPCRSTCRGCGCKRWTRAPRGQSCRAWWTRDTPTTPPFPRLPSSPSPPTRTSRSVAPLTFQTSYLVAKLPCKKKKWKCISKPASEVNFMFTL